MFLNMLMLAGVGGAAVPLVLHLLARARYRDVEWGAMMFLRDDEPRQAQSARLRQLALLGMRMLLVALLAMALARPVVRGHWSAVAQEGRITAVIILDRSFSMAFEEGGRTRFDKAREAALQILANLGKGDEVSLVLLGDEVEVRHREPTGNLQRVASEVADLTLSSGRADLQRGLVEAKAILDQPGRLNRELYIVTDRQAGNWETLRGMGGGAHRRWLSDTGSPTRFYVIPVGGEDVENVAIESIELLDPVAVRNQPAEVEVRLRNYGAGAAAAMDLSLSIISPSDLPRRIAELGSHVQTVAVTVGPRSTATVRIPVVFRQAGSHVIVAQVSEPGLAADNRQAIAVDVTDPVEVLIVSGDERGDEIRRESFFLRLALAPFQTAMRRRGDAAVVTVKGVDEWAQIDLEKFKVVILANVPQLTPEHARKLEQRVYEGGGLIIAPGNLSRIENYNLILYRNGLGLMPARLELAVPPDGSQATTLLGLELAHPVFRFSRGAELLPTAVVGRFFPAVPRQADARVLGRYASGEPFLVEGPRGSGRVLLVTTPLDADWNTLPLYPFFLPFVQSMVRYASAPILPPRNLAPGETMIAAWDEAVEGAELTRDGQPAGAIGPVELSGTRYQIRHGATSRPGIYRLEAKVKADGSRPAQSSRVVHFVVQIPGVQPSGEGRSLESDLTPLSASQWQELADALNFVKLEPAQIHIGQAVARERAGLELWLLLIVGVVALGIGELWLSRRWSREVE